METIVENVWTKSKLLVKALIIAGIVLVLQIPAFYIRDLIEEREMRQKEAITEVSSKWAGRQNISGPVLVLPYWENTGGQNKIKQYASFLPDNLSINCQVKPQEKYRGIYKVMLYHSNISLNGVFQNIQPEKLQIVPTDIIWNEAYVQIYLSDIRGLNEEMKLNWKGQQLPLTVKYQEDTLEEESLFTPVPLTGMEDLQQLSFSTSISLNGSDQLLFTPLGRSTTVNVNSGWPHPSFTGNTLPQSTVVKDSGFTATWKSLAHKRNFPQQWIGNAFSVYKSSAPAQFQNRNLAAASFGTNLYIPVNGYQKTMRSVKYAALCLLLTFASFFLIETSNKRAVHPFQYGLVGLALILFYTLLLSFSEYMGFNVSYVIASLLTIGLIAWFLKGLLGSGRLTMIFAALLVLMYTYIFTILQLQDYSLLLGSIGLFLTLAVVMHFSKKFQW